MALRRTVVRPRTHSDRERAPFTPLRRAADINQPLLSAGWDGQQRAADSCDALRRAATASHPLFSTGCDGLRKAADNCDRPRRATTATGWDGPRTAISEPKTVASPSLVETESPRRSLQRVAPKKISFGRTRLRITSNPPPDFSPTTASDYAINPSPSRCRNGQRHPGLPPA